MENKNFAMDDLSLAHLHAFRLIPEVGNRTLEILNNHFGGSVAAWQAPDAAILECPGIRSEKTRDAIVTKRRTINPLAEWEKLRALDISLFSPEHPLYPKLLRELPDRPLTLYVRGTFDWSVPRTAIAIVGSRKYTTYGEQVAQKLAEDLTRAGVLVISGMAFGIDAIAHAAALDAAGETIAVLGSGITDEDITPRSHFRLAEKILAHGALVSEIPPGGFVAPGNFPTRNRIIAGLSLGTLVIEAAEKSGSLITARLALEYGRDVFAIPGSIFSPASVGTNALLRQGAKTVSSVKDILEELPIDDKNFRPKTVPEPPATDTSSPEATKILMLLSHEPVHINTIIARSTFDAAKINAALAILEINGIVKNIGGMNYVKL